MNTIDQETWNNCVGALNDEWLDWLSRWRGFLLDFCRLLRDQHLIGVYNNCIALPVHDVELNVVAVHYRLNDGIWNYAGGTKVTPLLIGNPSVATVIYIFESQWDAFAFLERTGKYTAEGIAAHEAIIITLSG